MVFKMPLISIIIPTKNEEKRLPLLLNCLKRQTFKDFEVVVADAKSEDQIREIAKNYGCKIVDGGVPSIGRNNGVKVAKGDIFIFFDADIIIPKNFLEVSLKLFKKKKLDVGAFYTFALEKKVINDIIVGVINVHMFFTQKIKPYAWGFGIIIKRELHEAINGFNEKLYYFEDSDYVRKASKLGKFAIFNKKSKLRYSFRRFEREGIINMIFKCLKLMSKKDKTKIKYKDYFKC